MGFKEKLQERYTKSYLDKYGDRLASVQGNAVSIKIEEKTFLWIRHTLQVLILVRPERSKITVRCLYTKKKWFKKPPFMQISQGNLLMVQGMKGIKGKEDRETLNILNIFNQTTKKELFDTGTQPQKLIQKQQKMR